MNRKTLMYITITVMLMGIIVYTLHENGKKQTFEKEGINGECVQETDCDKSQWCNASGYDTWCDNQGKAGQCPAPYCKRSTSAETTQAPATPAPATPAPATPAPATPAPATQAATGAHPVQCCWSAWGGPCKDRTNFPTCSNDASKRCVSDTDCAGDTSRGPPTPGPPPPPPPPATPITPVVPNQPVVPNTPGPPPPAAAGAGAGTNTGPTSNGWDDAYFFSGGMGGMYNTSDISYKNTDKSLSANPSTGADPSCGAGDPKTLKKCMNKEKYNLNYASPYQSGIDNNCQYQDAHIQFVNPTKQGKVASIAHGTFGQGVSAPDAACTIGKYDTSVDGTGTDGQRPKAFSNRVNQLYSIMSNCGKDTKNYTKVFDIDGTNKACLITKQAFKDAKVPLPDAEGELPISNDGVAISAGHGVGKGSCGQLSLMQQGKPRGTNPQPNPGNTVLNVQIDTRAWSGEWGDTMDGGPQKYLTQGMAGEDDSTTCLQPRMRVLTKAEGNNLLSTVCSAMPGGACQIESGTCNGEPKCKNQTKAWCDAVPECTWTSTGTVPIGTTPSPTTPSPTTPSPTTPSPTTPSPTTPGPGTSGSDQDQDQDQDQGPGPSAGNIQFLGGWSNCTKSTTWRTAWGCNTILIGPFGGTRPILCETDKPYTNIWYTIGGEGINPTLDANLINTALSYYKGPAGQVNGICFDIESGLTLDMVRAWLKQHGAQAKAAGLQYLVATPQESTTMPEVTDGFTHVALMMYTGNQSYPSYDPFVGNFAGYDINNLIKNGWPSSKLMFTYQSYSASNYSGAATMFKNMVSACTTNKPFSLTSWGSKYTFKGPFAGILAWPAQEDKQPCQPQKDIKNMKLVLQAMGLSTNININCSSTSGSDTTPSPTTAGPGTSGSDQDQGQDQDQGPGPAPYSGTCEIPDVNTIQTGSYNSEAQVCKKYKNANKNTNKIVTWKEMAEAWKASGNNMKYCPEALIIGGGECQGIPPTGCSIQATGLSGIWQVDSARGGDFNLFNPCDNARAVYDQLVRPEGSYDKGCYSGKNGSVTSSLRITGAPPGGGGVGGADKSFWNTSGDPSGNCNWFGPFCHWQKSPTTKDTCCAWTGGGNSNQPQGFPYYYQKKFLEYSGVENIPECNKGNPQACKELANKSYTLAKSICDKVPSSPSSGGTTITPSPSSPSSGGGGTTITPSPINPSSGDSGGDSGGDSPSTTTIQPLVPQQTLGEKPTHIVGQWLMNMPPAGTQYNMISNGLMKPTGGFFLPAQNPDPDTLKNVYYRFATYGGSGVGGDKFPGDDGAVDLDYIFKKWANPNNCGSGAWQNPCGAGLPDQYNGIDFDIEGGLAPASGLSDGNLNRLITFIKNVKIEAQKRGKPMYFQITVNGNIHGPTTKGTDTPSVTPALLLSKGDDGIPYIDHFDFIAVMLYGGSMGACGGGSSPGIPYGDWCPSMNDSNYKSFLNTAPSPYSACKSAQQNQGAGCGTSQYMKDWLDSDIPKNKIIIAMARDATAAQAETYARIVKDYGLAGISFWQGPAGSAVDAAGQALGVPVVQTASPDHKVQRRVGAAAAAANRDKANIKNIGGACPTPAWGSPAPAGSLCRKDSDNKCPSGYTPGQWNCPTATEPTGWLCCNKT